MTATPARRRAELYATKIPAGASYEITEDLTAPGLDIAQLLVKGGLDTILITISNRRGQTRTRASAQTWMSHVGKTRTLRVREITYTIRNLYISRSAS